MNRGQKAIINTIPAPVGGLNDIDSIASMPATDAIEMDNIFPGTSSCSFRGGSIVHQSGIGAPGETLLTYNGLTTKKLFVAAGTQILDVTVDGGTPLLQITGLTNARWDFVNFGGNAGNHLVAVNGADLPLYYNGTIWAASGTGFATAITGVDARTFTQASAFKDRLYFVQKDSMKCWYLGTNSIGGAASALDFSGVARMGGKLVATTRIPSSAGEAMDDYFVAITSEGEILVYQGTDPSAVSTFALKGVYQAGAPIANGSAMDGSRFLTQFASDIVIVTADGFITLQGALSNDVVSQEQQISRKIVNRVKRDTSQYRNNFGWQIVLAPKNTKLLINVPTGYSYYQYVMNTITGAWCRFTGLNVRAWAYFDNNLYGVIDDVAAGGGPSSTTNTSTVYRIDVEGVQEYQETTTYTYYTSYVWTRNDSGVTFPAVTNESAMSNDGQYMYVTCLTSGIYKSSDYGSTWTLIKTLYPAAQICCSSTGQYVFCTSVNSYTGYESFSGAWVSNNYGVTWTQQFGTYQAMHPNISSDGSKLIFWYNTAYPKISSDYGVTFQNCSSFGGSTIYQIYMTRDGNYVYSLTGSPSGYPRISSFANATVGAWTTMTGIANSVDKREMCTNHDGSIIMICGLFGNMYKSIDNGTTFTKITMSGTAATASFSHIDCDYSGANMAVIGGASTASVYLSKDFGETWTSTKEVIPTVGAAKATGDFSACTVSSNGLRIIATGAAVASDTGRYYVYIGVGV